MAASVHPQQPMMQGSEQEFRKPEQFGPFLVGKTLGEGSFGKVKLGTHVETGQKVALKIIDRKRFQSGKDHLNLQREIQILKMLSHPNVVKMYDVIEDDKDELTILVMEFIAGGDLFELIIKNQRLSEVRAARMFRQMVDTIEYCHTHMIIHRDLKPENIMLDEHENVKINDFGLSNFMKPGTFLETYCGSPHYCSPEIMKERGYIGPEVDVWSLGVLLYTMVTGLFPWEGDNLSEVMKNAVRANYQTPDYLSADCKNLIGRMIVPQARLRATLAEVKMHPWLNDGLRIPAPARRRQVDRIDEKVFKKLADFGFGDEESRNNITQCKFTSQAYVLYNLILEHNEREDEDAKKVTASDPLARRGEPEPAAPVSRDERRRRHLSSPAAATAQMAEEVQREMNEKLRASGVRLAASPEAGATPPRATNRPRRQSLISMFLGRKKDGEKDAKGEVKPEKPEKAEKAEKAEKTEETAAAVSAKVKSERRKSTGAFRQ